MLNTALRHFAALLLLAGLLVGGALSTNDLTGLTEREEVRERSWSEADAKGPAPDGKHPQLAHETANCPLPLAMPARTVIATHTAPANRPLARSNSPRSPPAKARRV